jgi:transcriptional regulator with XRE-family HTH domain
MPRKKVKKTPARAQTPEESDLRTLIGNVKARRKKLGLTLGQASLACGLEAQYLAHFEKGLRPNPEYRTLTKFRVGLKTTLAWLMTERPDGDVETSDT